MNNKTKVATQLVKKNNTLGGRRTNKWKAVLKTPFSDPMPLVKSETSEIIKTHLTNALTASLRTEDTIKSWRKEHHVRLGMNETTRALERNELCLLLISKQSTLLVKHLAQLAVVRNCPCIMLPSLEFFSKHLTLLTRVSCFGLLKTCSGTMAAFVAAVSPLAPSLDLPWLSFEEAMSVQLQQVDQNTGNFVENSADQQAEVNELSVDVSKEECTHEDVDYSHLYVLKSETGGLVKEHQTFDNSFIAFGSESEDDEDYMTQKHRLNTDAIGKTNNKLGNKRKTKWQKALRSSKQASKSFKQTSNYSNQASSNPEPRFTETHEVLGHKTKQPLNQALNHVKKRKAQRFFTIEKEHETKKPKINYQNMEIMKVVPNEQKMSRSKKKKLKRQMKIKERESGQNKS